MAYLEWQESYNTGISQIDEEHKKLVELINRLNESIPEGEVNPEIGAVLIEIVNYTKYHITNEERIMEKMGYPELARQKKMHQTIKQNISSILMRLKRGHEINVYEMLTFLKGWFINHVLKEDKKIGDYFMKRAEAHNQVKS